MKVQDFQQRNQSYKKELYGGRDRKQPQCREQIPQVSAWQIGV